MLVDPELSNFFDMFMEEQLSFLLEIHTLIILSKNIKPIIEYLYNIKKSYVSFFRQITYFYSVAHHVCSVNVLQLKRKKSSILISMSNSTKCDHQCIV